MPKILIKFEAHSVVFIYVVVFFFTFASVDVATVCYIPDI